MEPRIHNLSSEQSSTVTSLFTDPGSKRGVIIEHGLNLGPRGRAHWNAPRRSGAGSRDAAPCVQSKTARKALT
jgi:hypothetical protein